MRKTIILAAAASLMLAGAASAQQQPAPATPAPKASEEAAKPPAPATDCATLLRRFRESSECYAPFFNVNGTMKPDAFETCGPAVAYPARECS